MLVITRGYMICRNQNWDDFVDFTQKVQATFLGTKTAGISFLCMGYSLGIYPLLN